MSKKIKLTQGKYAIVDDDDFEYLSRFSWHWDIDSVAMSVHDRKGNEHHIDMHRFIKRQTQGHFTKYINGEPLDNRKSNLIEISRALHTHQKIKHKNCSSIYKGVSKVKAGGFMSYISTKKQRVYIGYFMDEKEAAKAYNTKALEIYGDFAYQNKIK